MASLADREEQEVKPPEVLGEGEQNPQHPVLVDENGFLLPPDVFPFYLKATFSLVVDARGRTEEVSWLREFSERERQTLFGRRFSFASLDLDGARLEWVPIDTSQAQHSGALPHPAAWRLARYRLEPRLAWSMINPSLDRTVELKMGGRLDYKR